MKISAWKALPADALASTALAAAVICLFYPGAMSADSVNQLHEALHPQNISNWYPPSMVYLWSLLNKITSGQQGMLIFHNAVYCASLCLLGRCFFSKNRHRVPFLLFLGLFPPIFFMNGVIWKDVSLLAALSMSIALLFTFESTRNKGLLLASALFFFYGISVRHNAIVCVIPYSVYLFQSAGIQRKTGIVLAAALMLCAGVQMNQWITNTLVKAENRTHHLENASLMQDLWGMSAELEQNLIPASLANELVKPLTVKQIKRMYVPYTATMLSHEYLKGSVWSASFPDSSFKKEYLQTVLRHPGAYLKARGRMLSHLLGIEKPIICAYEFGVFAHPLTKDLGFRQQKAIDMAGRLAQWMLTNTPLYVVWVYFVLMALQLCALWRCNERLAQHRRQQMFVLALGATYWLPYLIISPSADFRYSNLTVYCSILMLPVMLRQLLSSLGRDRAPAGELLLKR